LSQRYVTILPTWHPAGMMRFKAKAARSFLLHLRKAMKVAAQRPADRTPKVLINPSDAVARSYLNKWEAAAFDTETPPDGGMSRKIYSLAASGEKGTALVWDLQNPNVRTKAVKEALASTTLIKVFQNGAFDLPILDANGLMVKKVDRSGRPLIWDTMIDNQIRHPDEPANLSYLASINLDIYAWKHLKNIDQLVYNGLDANFTFRIYAEGL